MEKVNFPQLSGMVIENKGFSFNPTTGQLNPETGYMVSLSGYEHREPLEGKSAIAIERLLYKYFLGSFKYALLVEPEKRDTMFFGAWVTEDNVLVLDVSRRFEKRAAAGLFQLLNKQEAVWNCAEGKSESIHVPLTIVADMNKMTKEDVASLYDGNGFLIYVEGVTAPIRHPDHDEV